MGELRRKGKKQRRRKSDGAYELQDLTVQEVSLVDHPAIGREFVTKMLFKSALPPMPARKAAPEPEPWQLDAIDQLAHLAAMVVGAEKDVKGIKAERARKAEEAEARKRAQRPIGLAEATKLVERAVRAERRFPLARANGTHHGLLTG